MRKLEDATTLLSGYGVVANESKLRAVRDRLLGEEMKRLETELQTLHGLVLVEGDWAVDSLPEGYKLRSPAVNQVSNPLYFTVFVRKREVSQKNQDEVQALKGQLLRLSVFGSVAAGASNSARDIHVGPVAIF